MIPAGCLEVSDAGRLDFEPRTGLVPLHGKGLPDTAARIAEREGVQIVALAVPERGRVPTTALNNERTSDLRTRDYTVQAIGDVPFLNGGLFSKDKRDEMPGIAVPDEAIRAILLGLFERFNFTITESTPFDVEVAGERVRFPEPVLDNVFYRLDKVYARAGKFDDIQAALARHRGARYLAVEYLKPQAHTQDRYRDLLRARNRVARLMRHLLFKRLESSVAAFRSTLGTLIRSNRNFRASLDVGFVPIGQTATALLSGETFDAAELLDRLVREELRRAETGARRRKLVHPADDFEIDA